MVRSEFPSFKISNSKFYIEIAKNAECQNQPVRCVQLYTVFHTIYAVCRSNNGKK